MMSVSEVKCINDAGDISTVGFWSQPPIKALVCAIEQFVMNNYNTWNYEFESTKHRIHESERGFSYFYGDNSVLYVTK